MASRRATALTLRQASKPTVLPLQRLPLLFKPRSSFPTSITSIQPRFKSIQTSPWSSEPREQSTPQKWTFEQIQARLPSTAQPADSPSARPLILIDVREPAELATTGRIPGAHNIPISSAPEGMFLPREDFQDRWGFEKPRDGDEVVFYCKAGVRSRAAAGMVNGAKDAGWEGVRVGEFPGSWVEWEGRGGEVERT